MPCVQAEGISAEGLTCDVRKQQECEQVIQHVEQKYGKLNILVNCAAGNFLAPAEMLTPNGFRTGQRLITSPQHSLLCEVAKLEMEEGFFSFRLK